MTPEAEDLLSARSLTGPRGVKAAPQAEATSAGGRLAPSPRPALRRPSPEAPKHWRSQAFNAVDPWVEGGENAVNPGERDGGECWGIPGEGDARGRGGGMLGCLAPSSGGRVPRPRPGGGPVRRAAAAAAGCDPRDRCRSPGRRGSGPRPQARGEVWHRRDRGAPSPGLGEQNRLARQGGTGAEAPAVSASDLAHAPARLTWRGEPCRSRLRFVTSCLSLVLDATTVVVSTTTLKNVVYLRSQRSAITVRASCTWWLTAPIKLSRSSPLVLREDTKPNRSLPLLLS